MGILEALSKSGADKRDKYCLSDFVLAKEYLDSDAIDSIPLCMCERVVKPDGTTVSRVHYDIVCILAWIAAKRNKKDITLEEVSETIDSQNLPEVIQETFYYWTNLTRDHMARLSTDETEQEGQEDVNPPAGDIQSENNPSS